jgi:hypothetical protein
VTIYWCLFGIAAFGAIAPGRLPKNQARWVWFGVGTVFALIMGFRFEVGADWGRYLEHFQLIASMTFMEALAFKDPGYYSASWLVDRLGGNKSLVNFFCAVMLMWGTVSFSRRQPYPWISLLAAVPYLLIVVGMGYTRQGAALGFTLLGLVALSESRVRGFAAFIILGALFHKSAILLLPIAALVSNKNRLTVGLSVVMLIVLSYYVLVQDSAEFLWNAYIEEQMQSEGAAIRVAMNAVPAVIFLIFRKRMVPEAQERTLWVWMALFSLACVPMLSLSSTAVDRVALYLIPLQMYVFSRLPRLGRSADVRAAMVVAIVGYFFLIQATWLNFASHAQYWLPYRFAVFH